MADAVAYLGEIGGAVEKQIFSPIGHPPAARSPRVTVPSHKAARDHTRRSVIKTKYGTGSV